MAIIFYISFLVSPPFLLLWLARREKSRTPSVWRILLSIGAAIPLALFLYLAAHIPHMREGYGSLIYIFHGLSIAIVLSCFSGKELGDMLSALTIFTVLLYVFHIVLSSSSHYTDRPKGRNFRIEMYNRRAKRSGQPLLPEVVSSPEWHTWLTRFHAVREKK